MASFVHLLNVITFLMHAPYEMMSQYSPALCAKVDLCTRPARVCEVNKYAEGRYSVSHMFFCFFHSVIRK